MDDLFLKNWVIFSKKKYGLAGSEILLIILKRPRPITSSFFFELEGMQVFLFEEKKSRGKNISNCISFHSEIFFQPAEFMICIGK